MTSPRNIAVVTIDWSDDYTGGALSGRHGEAGHERYNFLPSKGVYYGYFPPNGYNFPTNKGSSKWLIFFVARPRRDEPSVVVGWYEDATIVGSHTRPDVKRLPTRSDEHPFSYSAMARSAVCIPAAARDCVLPKGRSLRSFAFVRADGEDADSREALIQLLLRYRQRVLIGTSGQPLKGRNVFSTDPELRKQVAEAAVAAIKEDFGLNYNFIDKQKVPGTGYDLEFEDKVSGEIWCIEVKGTGGSRDVFFITRTERKVGCDMLADEKAGDLRRWRLALVTSALDPERRGIKYFDFDQLEECFQFDCLQWQAVSKNGTAE